MNHLFDSYSIQTLGTFQHENIHATVAFCISADVMPGQDVAVNIFKEVPAKLVLVPVTEVIRAVMSFTEFSEKFQSFDEYHAWYLNLTTVPEYSCKNRWPCIASDDKNEFIFDGWHRMHSYIRSGHETIPILQYDFKAWWTAHEAWKEKFINNEPNIISKRLRLS